MRRRWVWRKSDDSSIYHWIRYLFWLARNSRKWTVNRNDDWSICLQQWRQWQTFCMHQTLSNKNCKNKMKFMESTKFFKKNTMKIEKWMLVRRRFKNRQCKIGAHLSFSRHVQDNTNISSYVFLVYFRINFSDFIFGFAFTEMFLFNIIFWRLPAAVWSEDEQWKANNGIQPD